MCDCGVFEILRDFSLTPYLMKERNQVIHELGTTVLVDLSRDRVRSGCFSAGELLHGPDGFVERGRKVGIDVGLHLRQTGDGGIGDGEGTNLCPLSVEGTAVGAEEGSIACGWRTLDSLGRGEEVLPFLAVRLPLDFLSFASSPGILHFARSLLDKAATAVESSSVVIGGAVDVGFVQTASRLLMTIARSTLRHATEHRSLRLRLRQLQADHKNDQNGGHASTPPNAAYSVLRIYVSGTKLKTVDNFAYIGVVGHLRTQCTNHSKTPTTDSSSVPAPSPTAPTIAPTLITAMLNPRVPPIRTIVISTISAKTSATTTTTATFTTPAIDRNAPDALSTTTVVITTPGSCDVDSVPTSPHCDHTFTSCIGLVSYL
ncbi:hypothetical protein SprV_0401519600 [Sparganum proliferum]